MKRKQIFIYWLTLVSLGSFIRGQETYDRGFTAPSRPTLFATVDQGKVQLYWDAVAEASTDSLTGYADFEGYKIYRSLDGGITWGSPSDRLYDYDGNFVGWRPLAQFDLSLEEDLTHCIYSDSTCEGSNGRGVDISGYDPLSVRSYLGSNTGLVYSYTDSGVVDGKEYTYSITAYDMGLRTYTVRYVLTPDSSAYEPDTVWSASNPDHWTALDGGGYPSLECPRGSGAVDRNYITVLPGVHASNITFPDENNVQEFILRQAGTVGNGNIQYSIVNEADLSDVLLRLEINAKLADDALEGMASVNPLIYIYEVDDLDSQMPLNTIQFDVATLSPDSLSLLLDLPGAVSDGFALEIPDYLLTAPMNEWSDFLDGIRFQFDNMPEEMPGEDSGFEVISDLEWHADSTVINSLYFEMSYVNSAVYRQHPNFDYKIEFGTGAMDTVDRTSPSSACRDLPTNTVLPFRITNLTTGERVILRHTDKGVNGLGSATVDDEGYKDCRWTRNEELQFYKDFAREGTDTVRSPIRTYTLKMDIDLFQAYQDIGEANLWVTGNTYTEGTYVYYEGMIWKASRDIYDFIDPVAYVDDDGDTINDNPWVPVYPWKDGDYVIIKTRKTFVDGDAWVADMSLLGTPHTVTQDEIDGVMVVPNPYIVHSRFNETATERRLRFTHLPQFCRITIFTITGEVVKKIDHASDYDGNEWWDLTTGNNQLVAPGLYFYLVESDNKNYLGKFAVVR